MGYLRRLGGWGSPGESLIGTLCSACALWETDDELVSAAHARFPQCSPCPTVLDPCVTSVNDTSHGYDARRIPDAYQNFNCKKKTT